MKTTIKRENDEFLVITLKHVSGLTSHANLLGNPKLWAIALENGHKTRKLWVFGYNPQPCIGSLKPRKSPRNMFESYDQNPIVFAFYGRFQELLPTILGFQGDL